MATSNQQIFMDTVAKFLTTMPRSAGRCDAHAALSFVCAAKCTFRYALSSWAWRALRACEVDAVRMAHIHQQHYIDLITTAETLIRSNSNIQGGSFLSRIRRLITEHAISTTVLVRLPQRIPTIRSWVTEETQRQQTWYSPDSLAEDLAQPRYDEDIFTDSDEDSVEPEDPDSDAMEP